MTLYQKLEGDMKTALKAGNSNALSVLRMLISAVKMFEIEKNVKEAQEADILQIIQRQVKQHRESIEQFTKGNRKDLADKEMEELRVLEAYLPKQLELSELETIVKAAIAETGSRTKADMGKVMKVVMEKAMGRADGTAVRDLVIKFLK